MEEQEYRLSTGQTRLPTHFPKRGDNQEVALENSEFPTLSLEVIEATRKNRPTVWKKGRHAREYAMLRRAKAGEDSPAVRRWIVRREKWARAHADDQTLPGIVSQFQWGVVNTKGQQYMFDIVRSFLRIGIH